MSPPISNSTSSAGSAQPWRRIDGVDALRGLAILFVLLNHVNMRLRSAHIPYTQSLPSALISPLIWNGQNGVQIFFVISGFLITATSLRRWGSLAHVNVRDFYLLRFARIAPLFLALLAVLTALHFMQLKNFVVAPKTGGIANALLYALTFRINVLEAARGYLPANWDILWSLSVEEVFYLAFPLLCRLLGRGRLLVAVLVGFAALGPFARILFTHGNEVWHEYSYLGGMDAIALGCLTALLLAKVDPNHSALRALATLGAALVVFILGFSTLAAMRPLQHLGLDMSILALGTAMLIVAATRTQWKCPRLLAWLPALGERSYEIYLTHMFVVFAFFELFLSMGKPIKAVPLLFVVTILLAGLLGALVASRYSEPMNRALRRRLLSEPLSSRTRETSAL